MAILEAHGISKSYVEGEGGHLSVLEGVNFSAFEGRFIAITGESGVGKSTLLHLLGFLDKPDSGKILFDGLDSSMFRDVQLSNVRNRRIGFIFQFHHLLPEFDARENVAIPARIAGMSMSDSFDKASELLDLVGLSERASHFPKTLSGGELQRVALARALVNEPSIVIADEPTGNLDAKNERKLIELLLKITREKNMAVVLATHNRDLADMADATFLLEDRILKPFPEKKANSREI